MVDFGKRLSNKAIEKKVNPIEIYDTLDRASDKGPLRPVQETILKKWFCDYQDKRDIILKLHTGQGKTLIGLLMLQSYLNRKQEPMAYLCPNNYLVQQTCMQAKSFGISFVTAEDELPEEFLDGKKILITSCQKMFNGRSKFGIGPASMHVSVILMDDAHQCMEIIKNSCKIKIDNSHKAYTEIFHLFSDDLRIQGAGTFADIENNDYNAFLPVPYWAWIDRESDVVRILSDYRESDELKYVWPIIKDIIKECQCVISGCELEIFPRTIPLPQFKSYSKADHRIFMSATLSDDSFLIKDLGLERETIKNPLIIDNEKWSGEKMILFPSCISTKLSHGEIVNSLGKPDSSRKYGVVTLTPSFNKSKLWEKYGSAVAKSNTIYNEIDTLKNGSYSKTLVIANRYDGIDLPDNICRLLVIDSKPIGESLQDKYQEFCMRDSEVLNKKVAQKIEQGLGRAVRGEKDYCAILILGDDLIQFLRSSKTRNFFSKQTQEQVKIGLDISKFAVEEIDEKGINPFAALYGLINQLIGRNDGWKSYYIEQMNQISNEDVNEKQITIFEFEKDAEYKYIRGDHEGAIEVIQKLIDNHIGSSSDEVIGWYMQEMARYQYYLNKIESNKLQIIAHSKNPYLSKPKLGMQIKKIENIDLRRIENTTKWISLFDNHDELMFKINDLLTKLSFGADSDKFEESLHELGQALGFICQRPDKEWKEGPDNLWKIKNDLYLLIECKNQVDRDRREISRNETGQMNNSCVWFKNNYADVNFKSLMIISTNKLSKGAGFIEPVKIMKLNKLDNFKLNTRRFFLELKEYDLKAITETKIQELYNAHHLSVDELVNIYSEPYI